MDIISNPQQGDDSSLAQHPGAVGDTQLPAMDMERVLPRQQSTGLSRGIQQLGSPNVYVDSGNEQIIVRKTLPQVLMGNQINLGEGFYVTKEGIDVTKAKDGADFIFNSNQNVFKIIDTGNISIPAINIPSGGAGLYNDVNTNVGAYRHSLGYKPAFLAYMEFTNGVRAILPYTLSQSAVAGTTATWQTYNITVTTTFFFISLRGMVYNGGFNTLAGTVKFFLLQESAGLDASLL